MIEKAKLERSSRPDPDAQNFIEVFLDEIDKNAGNQNSYFTGTASLHQSLDYLYEPV